MHSGEIQLCKVRKIKTLDGFQNQLDAQEPKRDFCKRPFIFIRMPLFTLQVTFHFHQASHDDLVMFRPCSVHTFTNDCHAFSYKENSLHNLLIAPWAQTPDLSSVGSDLWSYVTDPSLSPSLTVTPHYQKKRNVSQYRERIQVVVC